MGAPVGVACEADAGSVMVTFSSVSGPETAFSAVEDAIMAPFNAAKGLTIESFNATGSAIIASFKDVKVVLERGVAVILAVEVAVKAFEFGFDGIDDE